MGAVPLHFGSPGVLPDALASAPVVYAHRVVQAIGFDDERRVPVRPGRDGAERERIRPGGGPSEMREEGEFQGEVARDPPFGFRERRRRPEGMPDPLREAVDPRAGGSAGIQGFLQIAEVVEDDPEQCFERGDGALAAGLRLAPERFRQRDAKTDPRSVTAALRSSAR